MEMEAVCLTDVGEGRWAGYSLGQNPPREKWVSENKLTLPLASSLLCFEKMIAFVFTREISEIGVQGIKSGNQNLG